MDNLSLLPYPRSLAASEGCYTLKAEGRIVLAGEVPRLLGAGRRLQAALAEHAQVHWELSAGEPDGGEEAGVVLRLRPGAAAHDEGYELAITPGGVMVEGSTPAGVFYGVCTLAQIVEQQGREL